MVVAVVGVPVAVGVAVVGDDWLLLLQLLSLAVVVGLLFAVDVAAVDCRW